MRWWSRRLAGPEPDAAAGHDDARRPRRAALEATTTAGLVQQARWTVRVGDAGLGACWHVAADGTVKATTGSAPAAARLPILDPATAISVLTALDILPTAAPPMQAGAGPQPAPDAEGRWPDPPPDEPGQPRRLLLRILGEPAVLLPRPDGAPTPVPIRRSAARHTLVLLALHRDGLPAADVKEALWPDTASSDAHRSMLTTLAELRRTLQHAFGGPVLRRDDPAAGTTGRYSLDPAAIQVDVWRLQDCLAAAALTTERGPRRRLLQLAAAVPDGDLAAGWTHPWLDTDRARINRHLLDLYTDLADTEPDHDTALTLLHRALRLAPGNEAIHRRVLQRHAAAGDTIGLRRAAATLTERLTELRLQPEPATIDLLNGLADTALPAAAGRPGQATTERSHT